MSWEIIIQAFWIILPAYIANASPAFLAGFFKRKFHPIDMNKKWNKKRLLGDGKTIEGTLFGIMTGTITAMIISILAQGTVYLIAVDYLLLGILLSAGALVGDIFGSIVKRRMGLKRGAKAPILDQLDFLCFALLFAAIVYIPAWEVIVFLLIVTPIIHLFVNFLGYTLGMKDVPW